MPDGTGAAPGAPGVPGVVESRRPALAVLRAVVRNPLDALPPEAFRDKLVHARLNGRVRVYACDPVLIRDALVGHADALAKGDDVRRTLGPALGDGLLTADGAHWRWQRQAAAPLFRHDRLSGFVPAMLAAAEATRDRWLAAAADGAAELELDVGREMMRTTFDVIVDTMLSGPGNIDVARVERGITDYLRPTGWMLALGLLHAPGWVPFPGRRRAMAAARYLRGAVTAMIADRRNARRDDLPGGDLPGNDLPGSDLVDKLLAAADPDTGRAMTDAEVADNLLTFITAGHETTASGLAWALHLLARHPDAEARLRAELRAVVGDGPVRAHHVERLAYARQVFQEALRLFPPAPIISRTVLRPFTLGGLRVPEGASLYVPIYALHRHAALWDRPEAFDPDRFAPERARARDRYAFLPFGAGPRVCIGAAFATTEAAAILAVLLRSVRLANVVDATPAPVMRLTLRPARAIRMRARAAA